MVPDPPWFDEALDHLIQAGALLNEHGLHNVTLNTVFGTYRQSLIADTLDYRGLWLKFLRGTDISHEEQVALQRLIHEAATIPNDPV